MSAFVTFAAGLMLTAGAEQNDLTGFAIALMPLVSGYAAGFLKQIGENISLLAGKLYRDRIAAGEPLDTDVWGCDEGFRMGDRTLYLRKGTKILYLSVWQGTDRMKEQAPQIAEQWFNEPPLS